ncbi:MAG: hypothetical protein JWM20_394 [Patescibacteria group bacterium]|nr:hypothetical protein [Patescibacteria group bacterium]
MNPTSNFEAAFQNKSVQFKSPEEEVAFLREQLKMHQEQMVASGMESKKEDAARDLIDAYKSAPTTEVLHPKQMMPADHVEGIVLKLRPETHDGTMGELMGIMMEKGIKNALDIVAKMNNPHIDDDFLRFLVQYLSSYHEIPGLKPNTELFKEINARLFEVTLPRPEEGVQKTFKDLTSAMEQFFAGMQAIGPGENPDRNWYTIEIALSNASDEVVFYISVPRDRSDTFEKVMLGLYADAKIAEITDDYNIFNEQGGAAGSYAKSSSSDLMTIKTYDSFSTDPLDVVLNVFSKLDKQGEGAAIQFTIRPAGDTFIRQYGKILDRLRKGDKFSEIKDEIENPWAHEAKGFGKAALSLFKSEEKKPDEPKATKYVDEIAIASITEKLKSSVIETNIRIIASAQNQPRAEAILHELESAFYQFSNTTGNGIAFKSVGGRDLMPFFHEFSYREMQQDKLLHLNFHELASLVHFPALTKDSPQLKQAKSGSAPAPLDMGTKGILLGTNVFRGKETPIYFSPADRLRHFYTIGQTGVGKTQMFLKMIIQDIKNGDGCCFIDPHGSDVQTILANIPPERMDDVIYFDPSYVERPMGLNMLEYDVTRPQQKSLVIGELLGIFDKLFDMKAQGGAMFGQYFRNAALLVMSSPELGNTLMEITRVLADKAFRDMKLSHCKDPLVIEFWKAAEKTTGDQGLENFVPYISGKFDDFISNEFMRPVVLQEKSAFNFRDVMDNKKILLVNLSKGLLGEKNANLIGLIMIGKLQMAAMSRADSADLSQFPPFYVYMDEFQNVVTESISAILSEARKYKLSLNMTHQYLEQLPPYIKGAVFGNVGTMGFFRINDEDAKFVEPRIKPQFSKDDIIKQDNFNNIMSMLVDGKPAGAFNMNTIFDGYAPKGNPEQIAAVKQLSYLKYGRDRADIEQEILNKFKANNG